uniref:Uncharacterized protein n=1 Tax=Anopheles merus TaxID=30066 RepID=A0A182USG6_ANOME
MSHQETMALWREVSAALDGKAKCRPRTLSVRLNCTNIPPGTASEEISLEMSVALGVFSDQINIHYVQQGPPEKQREEKRQMKSDARVALERAIKLRKDQNREDLPDQLEPHGFGPAYQIRK